MFDDWIEEWMSKLYDFLSFSISLYNKQAQMAAGMLGQDPASFNSSGWTLVTNVNAVFLTIGAVLVIIFFLMGFCADSVDIKQDLRVENILRMFLKLNIAEFFVINSLRLVQQMFVLGTGIIGKFAGVNLTVNCAIPSEVSAITSNPVDNGMSGFGGLMTVALLFITAFVFMLVEMGCGAMILFEAYQRFFKIMLLVPYGSLANSTIAGNHMLNRSAESFWKYALATILEAVTMYFSMALAAAVLSSGTLGLKDGWSGAFYVLGWILESSFVSMLTLGLVKGSEMVTQKALGL